MDLNEDCTVVMTASYDNTLKFWDLRSVNREPIQTLSDFRDSVTTGLSIAYMYLCMYVSSDRNEPVCMFVLTAAIVCTSDCAVLAGSVDGSVRVYDMRMGRLQVL